MVNIKNKNKQTKTPKASNSDPLANIYDLNMLNFNLIFLLGNLWVRSIRRICIPCHVKPNETLSRTLILLVSLFSHL